jgi:hypothetical protein
VFCAGVDDDVEKKEPLYTAGGNATNTTTLEKNFEAS